MRDREREERERGERGERGERERRERRERERRERREEKEREEEELCMYNSTHKHAHLAWVPQYTHARHTQAHRIT